MMKSNRPKTFSSLGVNLGVTNNIHIQRQLQSMQRGQASASQTIAKSAKTLRTNSVASNKAVVPLVRKRTAKQFADG